MKMKKVFLFALATAVMSFAGCQEKEQEAPVNPNEGGSTFEFVADIAQTKTTLDVENGYKVDWEEGDLVYMVTSDGTWGKPYNDDKYAATIAEFKYADGKFTSDATIAAAEYTFKGMYAAASQKPYHRGASSTHKLEATQTQDCANPTAHIKANDALVGTFTATVPMEEMAKMNMSHLYTLMQVNVKNATGAAVEVTRFEMTAEGADLAGIFNVTAFDTPALTTKQDATSTITVNLTGGSVEKDASLPVYFVMAPLSDYAGDVTFKVTDSEGKTYTKTVKMNSISFEAGKYNTTPYTIKAADVAEPEPEGVKTATISFASTAQRTSYSTTQQVWENEGVVFTNSKGSSTTNVGNYSNPARFYKSSNISVTAPGNITKLEFDCKGIGSDYVTPLSSLTGASKTGDIITISLDGTSSTIEYKGLSAQARANSLTVTYVIADPSAPSVTVGNVTGIPARGVELAELTYGVDNIEYSDLTVTCDGNVVTAAAKGEDGVINYAVSANQTASAREGLITISYGDLVKEVKVSQLAPVFTVSTDAVELGATKDSNTTVTVTSDFDWTLLSEGAGYTVTPNSYTWTTGGKETITIQATANRAEEGVADLGKITLTNSVTGQKLTIDVTQATSYVSQESIKVEMPIYANKGTKSGTSISWTKDGFTVKNTQANGSTAIRTSDSDHYRIYAKSQINFTSSNKKFNKVVVTCTGSSYATALKTSVEKAGLTATVSGSEVTISISAPILAMPTITASEQIRIKKVVVELN